MKRLMKSPVTRRESKTRGIRSAVRARLRRGGILGAVEAIRDQYILVHSKKHGRHVYSAYCIQHENPLKLAAASSWSGRTAKRNLEQMMRGKGCTRCASEAPPAFASQPKRQRDRGYATARV